METGSENNGCYVSFPSISHRNGEVDDSVQTAPWTSTYLSLFPTSFSATMEPSWGVTKERDGIEDSGGIIPGQVYHEQGELTHHALQSQSTGGNSFGTPSDNNVPPRFNSASPAATSEWGSEMMNCPHAFNSSSYNNGYYPKREPNLDLNTDMFNFNNASNVALMHHVENNATYDQSASNVTNFMPSSDVLPTATQESPVYMDFFHNQPLNEQRTENSEEILINKLAHSREGEELGSDQIPGQQISEISLEGRSAVLKLGAGDLEMVLYKELTKSDAGSIGRIVLPKRDAERNLPTLFEREGMTLYMDDLILPVTWKFKYRFWPNNNSRMYVLEATGDFAKTHELEAGDLFIIYKDAASGYFIVSGEKTINRKTPSDDELPWKGN